MNLHPPLPLSFPNCPLLKLKPTQMTLSGQKVCHCRCLSDNLIC